MMSPFDVSAFEHSIAIWVKICAICTVIALADAFTMANFCQEGFANDGPSEHEEGCNSKYPLCQKKTSTHPVTNGIFLSLKKPIDGCGQLVSITTKGFQLLLV